MQGLPVMSHEKCIKKIKCLARSEIILSPCAIFFWYALIILLFQIVFLEKIFSWIYEKKFNFELASKYFKIVSRITMSNIVNHFVGLEVSTDMPGDNIPNLESPFEVQTLYGLRKIDAHFNANVFRRVGPKDSDEQYVLVEQLRAVPVFTISNTINCISS